VPSWNGMEVTRSTPPWDLSLVVEGGPLLEAAGAGRWCPGGLGRPGAPVGKVGARSTFPRVRSIGPRPVLAFGWLSFPIHAPRAGRRMGRVARRATVALDVDLGDQRRGARRRGLFAP
jgi:hypothetical protein